MVPTGVTIFICAAIEALSLIQKKADAIHELIHAIGVTETSDQGFPIIWKKKRISWI